MILVLLLLRLVLHSFLYCHTIIFRCIAAVYASVRCIVFWSAAFTIPSSLSTSAFLVGTVALALTNCDHMCKGVGERISSIFHTTSGDPRAYSMYFAVMCVLKMDILASENVVKLSSSSNESGCVLAPYRLAAARFLMYARWIVS